MGLSRLPFLLFLVFLSQSSLADPKKPRKLELTSVNEKTGVPDDFLFTEDLVALRNYEKLIRRVYYDDREKLFNTFKFQMGGVFAEYNQPASQDSSETNEFKTLSYLTAFPNQRKSRDEFNIFAFKDVNIVWDEDITNTDLQIFQVFWEVYFEFEGTYSDSSFISEDSSISGMENVLVFSSKDNDDMLSSSSIFWKTFTHQAVSESSPFLNLFVIYFDSLGDSISTSKTYTLSLFFSFIEPVEFDGGSNPDPQRFGNSFEVGCSVSNVEIESCIFYENPYISSMEVTSSDSTYTIGRSINFGQMDIEIKKLPTNGEGFSLVFPFQDTNLYGATESLMLMISLTSASLNLKELKGFPTGDSYGPGAGTNSKGHPMIYNSYDEDISSTSNEVLAYTTSYEILNGIFLKSDESTAWIDFLGLSDDELVLGGEISTVELNIAVSNSDNGLGYSAVQFCQELTFEGSSFSIEQNIASDASDSLVPGCFWGISGYSKKCFFCYVPSEEFGTFSNPSQISIESFYLHPFTGTTPPTTMVTVLYSAYSNATAIMQMSYAGEIFSAASLKFMEDTVSFPRGSPSQTLSFSFFTENSIPRNSYLLLTLIDKYGGGNEIFLETNKGTNDNCVLALKNKYLSSCEFDWAEYTVEVNIPIEIEGEQAITVELFGLSLSSDSSLSASNQYSLWEAEMRNSDSNLLYEAASNLTIEYQDVSESLALSDGFGFAIEYPGWPSAFEVTVLVDRPLFEGNQISLTYDFASGMAEDIECLVTSKSDDSSFIGGCASGTLEMTIEIEITSPHFVKSAEIQVYLYNLLVPYSDTTSYTLGVEYLYNEGVTGQQTEKAGSLDGEWEVLLEVQANAKAMYKGVETSFEIWVDDWVEYSDDFQSDSILAIGLPFEFRIASSKVSVILEDGTFVWSERHEKIPSTLLIWGVPSFKRRENLWMRVSGISAPQSISTNRLYLAVLSDFSSNFPIMAGSARMNQSPVSLSDIPLVATRNTKLSPASILSHSRLSIELSFQNAKLTKSTIIHIHFQEIKNEFIFSKKGISCSLTLSDDSEEAEFVESCDFWSRNTIEIVIKSNLDGFSKSSSSFFVLEIENVPTIEQEACKVSPPLIQVYFSDGSTLKGISYPILDDSQEIQFSFSDFSILEFSLSDEFINSDDSIVFPVGFYLPFEVSLHQSDPGNLRVFGESFSLIVNNLEENNLEFCFYSETETKIGYISIDFLMGASNDYEASWIMAIEPDSSAEMVTRTKTASYQVRKLQKSLEINFGENPFVFSSGEESSVPMLICSPLVPFYDFEFSWSFELGGSSSSMTLPDISTSNFQLSSEFTCVSVTIYHSQTFVQSEAKLLMEISETDDFEIFKATSFEFDIVDSSAVDSQVTLSAEITSTTADSALLEYSANPYSLLFLYVSPKSALNETLGTDPMLYFTESQSTLDVSYEKVVHLPVQESQYLLEAPFLIRNTEYVYYLTGYGNNEQVVSIKGEFETLSRATGYSDSLSEIQEIALANSDMDQDEIEVATTAFNFNVTVLSSKKNKAFCALKEILELPEEDILGYGITCDESIDSDTFSDESDETSKIIVYVLPSLRSWQPDFPRFLKGGRDWLVSGFGDMGISILELTSIVAYQIEPVAEIEYLSLELGESWVEIANVSITSSETGSAADGWLCCGVWSSSASLTVEKVIGDLDEESYDHKCQLITGKNKERDIKFEDLSESSLVGCVGQTIDNRKFASTTELFTIKIKIGSDLGYSDSIEEEEEEFSLLLRASLALLLLLLFLVK